MDVLVSDQNPGGVFVQRQNDYQRKPRHSARNSCLRRGKEIDVAIHYRLGCNRSAHLDVFHIDRKSTRLNSSHGYISYAVFCLKKKKKKHSKEQKRKYQTPVTLCTSPVVSLP